MSDYTKAQLEERLAELQADLAAVDDFARRLAFVDDAGQPVLQSHEQMHKHHGEQPYIGCIFCRDKFGELAPLEEIAASLTDRIGERVDAFDTGDNLGEAIELARKNASGRRI